MCVLCMFSRWRIMTLSEISDKIDQRLLRLWICSSMEEQAEADFYNSACRIPRRLFSGVLLLAASMMDPVP